MITWANPMAAALDSTAYLDGRRTGGGSAGGLAGAIAGAGRGRPDERLLASVFHKSRDGICITDPAYRVVAANHAFAELLGYSESELKGRIPDMLVGDEQASGFRLLLMACQALSGSWAGEVCCRCKDGRRITARLAVDAATGGTGQVDGFIFCVSEIRGAGGSEAAPAELAGSDPLTGLPTGERIARQLGQALEQAAGQGGRLAVLCLKVHRVGAINDGCGHRAGDAVIREVVARVQGCLDGRGTLGRTGGNQLIAIMPGSAGGERLAGLAGRVMEALAPAFEVGGRSLEVSFSAGASLCPDHGTDPHALLRNADSATRHAEALGPNRFLLYREDMRDQAAEALAVEAGLRQALERGGLELYYQPQFSLASAEVSGAEALVRWDGPDGTPVPPERFIPIAEQSGLILRLGDWALRQACRQNRSWQAEGLPIVPVAVNLAAANFRDLNLASTVAAALRESGLDARFLELELTESSLMHAAGTASSVLGELKAMGLRLAVDDFGTGYSSLSYLKRFPVDKLKIDRSFVRDLARDADDLGITGAIVAMARQLRLQVVAEGVESRDQLEILRSQGCDVVQGHYAHPPVPAESFRGLLAGGTAPSLALHGSEPGQRLG